MDPNQPNSFMNLLTGDESQQQPESNAPNYPQNCQYPPPPYPLPQQNAYYPPPLYPPPQQNPYYPPPQTPQTLHMEHRPHVTHRKPLLLLN